MTGIRFARFGLVFLLLTFSVFNSANASAEGAQSFIKDVSNKALNLINDKKVNELMKEKQLSKLFGDSVDTAWIAKFAMGKYWRDTTEAQRQTYLKLHRQFLINSYVPKFKNYTNEKIDFKKFYDDGNNEYTVETEIVKTDGPSIRVDYKVILEADGTYKIIDVIAEGVSLIATQRSEFASILSRKGVDYLIEKLKQKV